jgi:small nuclear ribonucleoprotein (snRNP)-like protein
MLISTNYISERMPERPIDALDRAKGKKVFVKLKNGDEITGLLVALDLHLNLWLEDVDIQGENKRKFTTILIRGDTILYASPV